MFTIKGVTAKGFQMLLNKEADRTVSHSLPSHTYTFYITEKAFQFHTVVINFCLRF